jgi:LytS/YehU family sensor histidine kinase
MIVTQLIGQNLRITVSDTGPGLQSPSVSNRLSGVSFDGGEPVSTGVGLANIRDRLAQAYGEQHRFETMEPAEGGFAVVIELPLERREAAELEPIAPRIVAAAS